MKAILKLAATIGLAALIAGCAKTAEPEQDASTLSPQEAGEIARESYIFGSAFVSNYRVFIRMLV